MARFHEFTDGAARVIIDLDNVVAVESRTERVDQEDGFPLATRVIANGALIYLAAMEDPFKVDASIDEVLKLLTPRPGFV